MEITTIPVTKETRNRIRREKDRHECTYDEYLKGLINES